MRSFGEQLRPLFDLFLGKQSFSNQRLLQGIQKLNVIGALRILADFPYQPRAKTLPSELVRITQTDSYREHPPFPGCLEHKLTVRAWCADPLGLIGHFLAHSSATPIIESLVTSSCNSSAGMAWLPSGCLGKTR